MKKKPVIRCFPDQVLRRVSAPVIRIDDSVKQFARVLAETMYRQPGGVGMAAPQIGVLKRIAVVDISKRISGAKQILLINPRIRSGSKKKIIREGCMSLPDFTANVARWDEILVEWLDLDGCLRTKNAAGLEAVCIQHEVDHLNGFLFIDRVSSLKSDVFKRRFGV